MLKSKLIHESKGGLRDAIRFNINITLVNKKVMITYLPRLDSKYVEILTILDQLDSMRET